MRRVLPHQVSWGTTFAEGLRAHGIEVSMGDTASRVTGDFVACWGWRVAQQYVGAKPVLVFERGYVGDRQEWTSAGWNGLNGRARFPQVDDRGARWEAHFGHLLHPWRDGGEYALLMGQVRGDSAIERIDIGRWYAEAVAGLRRHGLPVVFRPHPVEVERGSVPAIDGAPKLRGSLEDALAHAAVVATYNSNTGVDAVLAGVPTIACDEGSMAWPVTVHGFDEPLQRPDRSEWCARLAWCQWSKDELRNGVAWEHLREAMPQ